MRARLAELLSVSDFETGSILPSCVVLHKLFRRLYSIVNGLNPEVSVVRVV